MDRVFQFLLGRNFFILLSSKQTQFLFVLVYKQYIFIYRTNWHWMLFSLYQNTLSLFISDWVNNEKQSHFKRRWFHQIEEFAEITKLANRTEAAKYFNFSTCKIMKNHSHLFLLQRTIVFIERTVEIFCHRRKWEKNFLYKQMSLK